MQSEL